MERWETETCPLCGAKPNNENCKVCEGKGFWEFLIDDNYLAMKALLEGVDEKVTKICNRRIAGITPDNIVALLDRLQEGFVPTSAIEQKHFDALYKAGAEKWEWAWLNTNRFAIELAKLNGVDYRKYRYALGSLCFGWLITEANLTF